MCQKSSKPSIKWPDGWNIIWQDIKLDGNGGDSQLLEYLNDIPKYVTK